MRNKILILVAILVYLFVWRAPTVMCADDTLYIQGNLSYQADSIRFGLITNDTNTQYSGWVENTYGRDTFIYIRYGYYYYPYFQIKIPGMPDGTYADWNIQAHHNYYGSVLEVLNDYSSTYQGENCSQGDGIDTLAYYAYDSCNTVLLEGVDIFIHNINWEPISSGTTGGTGLARFTLNDGNTYYIRAQRVNSGWTEDTLVFAAGMTDSIFGCVIDEPAAAPDSFMVAAYIDVGSGMVDSTTGNMIPRTDIVLNLNLIGESSLNDGSWAIIPMEHGKSPNADGRVTYWIPATLTMNPPGSYYELSYRSRDGYSISSGIIRKFILDTIPDPINILNTTEY